MPGSQNNVAKGFLMTQHFNTMVGVSSHQLHTAGATLLEPHS